ncbi:MAG: hypothetical protein ACYCW6_00245 [Candidatus Xenobia bacterium]
MSTENNIDGHCGHSTYERRLDAGIGDEAAFLVSGGFDLAERQTLGKERDAAAELIVSRSRLQHGRILVAVRPDGDVRLRITVWERPGHAYPPRAREHDLYQDPEVRQAIRWLTHYLAPHEPGYLLLKVRDGHWTDLQWDPWVDDDQPGLRQASA